MRASGFINGVLPAALLTLCAGQIYAFSVFSGEAVARMGASLASVQLAFSLGIFFLGTGAAFFGRLVERDVRASAAVGTALFASGLCVAQLGVNAGSLPLLCLGYGALCGTGTGVIYVTPVKTLMLWYPRRRAVAAALPIVCFGLGASLCVAVSRWLMPSVGVGGALAALAGLYLPAMGIGACLLRKPAGSEPRAEGGGGGFSYRALLRDPYFLRCWLFMFLNISCGLSLIPLAGQIMSEAGVGAPASAVVLAVMGLSNGAGRFLFALWSDRMRSHADILPVILGVSAAAALAATGGTAWLCAALAVVPACYGAGFSVMPAILSDRYGMGDLSKIHGAVLTAWGAAGLVGNQAAVALREAAGGYAPLMLALAAVYGANMVMSDTLRRKVAKDDGGGTEI